MRNWDAADETGLCSSDRDWQDVQKVCQQLHIPCFKVPQLFNCKVDYVKQYWNLVFEPALRGYAAGITPNPDIMCNYNIKFGVLLEELGKLQGGMLATGIHYC